MTVPVIGPSTALGLSIVFTLVLFLVEFVLVLRIGPRITRKLVHKDATAIFDQNMRPGIREEVGKLHDRIVERLVAEVGKLHASFGVLLSDKLLAVKVPAPADVAVAVRDALVEAQAKAMEGKPDPMEAFRAMVRAELDAALEKLAAEDAQLSVEDAAQVMSRKGVDARLTFAAQEEQFQAAVLKAAGTNGPLAVAALEQAKASFPATYKVMVRQGPAAVPAFFKQAGLKAMVGGSVAGDGAGLL